MMANEHYFKIGAVAKLTGMSSHNIRAWEKRYSAVVAHRHDSGRRYYTQQQVDRLLTLKKCISLGESIGNIAHLDDVQLQEKVSDLNLNNPTETSTKEMLTIGIIGPESLQTKIRNSEILQVNYRLDFAEFSPLEMEALSATEPVQVLFVDCASISNRRTNQIEMLAKLARAEHIILVYRFANQQNLQSLNQAGIKTLKTPLDDNALEILLSQLRPEASPKLPLNNKNTNNFQRYPRQIFSDQQLTALADLPSKIECECPNHLAELLTGLKAFEHYSGECLNKNDEDAALHSKIQRTTANARYQLELLLQEVLQAEGLSI